MKKPLIAGILFMILVGAFLLTAGCSDSSTVITPASSVTKSATSATPASIVMTTDKTQYIRDEKVRLKITNGLEVPVWYIGYPQRDLVFWNIERAQNNSWQPMDFRLPMIEGSKEVCRIIMYEQPIGAVVEMKPHSDLSYEWNQKICTDGPVTEPFEPEVIEQGRYRFVFRYSLDSVTSENIKTEPWKRPVDLGEITTIYSNEFVLE